MWSIKLYAHLLFKHSLSHGVTYVVILQRIINTFRSGQNGLYFPDDILKCIFMNDNVWISLNFSLKFVPKVSIDNTPALVQIMAWRRPGDKPLSEPMMISLLMHICVARPQWVLIRYNTYMSTEQIVYAMYVLSVGNSSTNNSCSGDIWRISSPRNYSFCHMD